MKALPSLLQARQIPAHQTKSASGIVQHDDPKGEHMLVAFLEASPSANNGCKSTMAPLYGACCRSPQSPADSEQGAASPADR